MEPPALARGAYGGKAKDRFEAGIYLGYDCDDRGDDCGDCVDCAGHVIETQLRVSDHTIKPMRNRDRPC